ncbi:MAG: hypothetical protein R2734_00370 [Nocardioides sp.]
MAAEQGLSVDESGFRRPMTEQRERAKADAKAKKGAHRDATAYRAIADGSGRPVEFTGYEGVMAEASAGIVADGQAAEDARVGDDRAGAGPHAVLCRGRRPAGRHRRDRAGTTARAWRCASCRP